VTGDLASVAGTFFRITVADRSEDLLRGALSPEGRYHHDGEPALYLSPRAEWAQMAVETYVRTGDPQRIVHRLLVGTAHVVDTRDGALCRKLGIEPSDSATPWQPQLAKDCALRPGTFRTGRGEPEPMA
jgi:hypothetical protein